MMIAESAPFSRIRRSLRGAAGIARSLRIYYGNPARRIRMAALYRQFVKPGDLVFDIGAHVGDRIAAFRSIGARVIGVEPQPAASRWLNMRYGRNENVKVIQAAMGEKAGQLTLHVNLANPTISTASDSFIAATKGAEGWEGQNWDETITVPSLTLDSLIADYGVPAFVKIDVEGFELNVLKGLSEPLPALSFEFTTIQREVGLACLERLMTLGQYRFNVALGESQAMAFEQAIDMGEMSAYISALPHDVNSGDIYARL
jgi:FkbM family methyltransferase